MSAVALIWSGPLKSFGRDEKQKGNHFSLFCVANRSFLNIYRNGSFGIQTSGHRVSNVYKGKLLL